MKIINMVFAFIAIQAFAYQTPNIMQKYCLFNKDILQKKLETPTTSILSKQQIEAITRITLAAIKQANLPETRDNKLVHNYSSELFNENNDLSYGNKDASNTVVEFVDYQCNHCKNLIKNVRRTAYQNPNLKVIIKELPILGKMSENAARAAIAASRQGKYQQYQTYLITSNDYYTKENLAKEAKKLHLDVKAFLKDFSSERTNQYLAKNAELAKKLLINATPTLVISSNNGSKNQIILGAINTQQIMDMLEG